MTRDTVAAIDEGSGTSGSGRDGAQSEVLIHRLANVERAYAELLQRVSQYERERAEIKRRLEGIMAQLDAAAPADVPRTGASSE